MVWISGSDQEKSLISAIEDTFNDVILVFCSLHLKDNLVRHMRTRNLPAKVKGKIMSAIFGTNGLVHCENEDEFNGRKLIFENKYGQFLSKPYMDDFLERVLRNVMNPAWVSDRIGLNWTNNDAGKGQ